MTEGGLRARGRPESAAGGAERTAARPAPARFRAHPLLRVFPLTVMTVATFLTVFTLLMARVTTLQGPPSPMSARVAAVAGGLSAVSARTSGAAASGTVASGPAASGGRLHGASAGTPLQRGTALATRSSVAVPGESRDD